MKGCLRILRFHIGINKKALKALFLFSDHSKPSKHGSGNSYTIAPVSDAGEWLSVHRPYK
jgi:hypothetical protein